MSLRSQIIRLAHTDAEIRPHLLRVLEASAKKDMDWALRKLKRGRVSPEDLKDIVDVLDARRGGPSISDDFSEVGREVKKLRKSQNPSGRRLQRALEKAIKKLADQNSEGR